MEYENLKTEIVDWAKTNSACQSEFKRLCAAPNEIELLEVLTTNWNWCWLNNFTIELLNKFSKESLKTGRVLINESGSGFIYAYENSTVEASENSTVEAYGNSTVRAYENSTVRAYENSTVEAYGNSTVEAYGNSTINSYNKNGHEVKDYAVCRFIEGDTVTFKVSDKFELQTK